jgi:hypothetical protein
MPKGESGGDHSNEELSRRSFLALGAAAALGSLAVSKKAEALGVFSQDVDKGKEEKKEQIPNHPRTVVLKMVSDPEFGAGGAPVNINGESFVLTALHVANAGRRFIGKYLGKDYGLRVPSQFEGKDSWKERDLALLKADEQMPDAFNFADILPDDEIAKRAGQKVYMFGPQYGHSVAKKPIEAPFDGKLIGGLLISGKIMRVWFIPGNFTVGMSGSPFVFEDGTLAGILISSAKVDGKRGSFALSTSEVLAVLHSQEQIAAK